MNLRLAVGWLEARFFDAHGVTDDTIDYLEGNDDELVERSQRRRRSRVMAGGGEIA